VPPTAIVVPFHDMPAVVAAHRRALTTDGADGMPPHVTLLYPFADDADLTEGEIERLRRALGPFAPFDVALTRFARFHAHPSVLYLEPEPVEVFLGMITALSGAFPAFPPFGGIHETVIPHLTLAYSDDDAALDVVEVEVGRHLPIHARVAEVAVMEYGGDAWRPRERIALGAE
jgi:2'-5' RNA ligase